MKNKYKIKKKRKSISVFNFILIGIILIISISTAYSLWSTNLTINGNVDAKRIQTGTININGMTVTLDEQGIVTIDGALTGNYGCFVKISNGLSAASLQNNTSDKICETWNNQDQITLAKAGYSITHNIEYISGTWNKKKELNVVIRDQSLKAILNCKLSSDLYTVTEYLTNDARMEYLYFEPGLTCDNVKIKTRIYKQKIEQQYLNLNLIPGNITYKGMTITVNDDKTITLNGKNTSGYFFVKVSGGLQGTTSIPSSWVTTSPIIANVGKQITFSTSVISGTVTGTELNSCLRTTGNASCCILKLVNGQTTTTSLLTKDISLYYLYINSGVECKDYVIKPYIEETEN